MLLSAIICAASTIVPLSLGVIFWRRIGLPLKIIVAYSFFSLICDVLSISLVLHSHHNTMVISIFAIGQVAILGPYFCEFIAESCFNVRGIVLYIATITGLVCYNFVFNNPANYIIALNTLGVVGLIIITTCILSFYRALKKLDVLRIELDPNFWIISGLLLQMASFVLLAFSSEIFSDRTFATLWKYFKNLTQVVMNLLFAVGIFLGAKHYSRERK
jgi:hypothetical protein